jgi:hypothetical protein
VIIVKGRESFLVVVEEEEEEAVVVLRGYFHQVL